MIQTINLKDKTLQTLLWLDQCPFDVFPTGSRLFGTAKADSDFDFYVGQEGEESLKDFGFFLLQTPGLDNNTINIYRKGKVDVAVLKQPLLRQQVEELARNDKRVLKMINTATTTEEQKKVWNFLYSTVVYNNRGSRDES